MSTLFKNFPLLEKNLPIFQCGIFPTPVEPLDGLCKLLGREQLYVKRDDVTSSLYGGNKVRKLEFHIGSAIANKAQRIITTGGAGSNHALATALYASEAGIDTTLLLFDQPVSPEVRKNLIADLNTGAEIIHDSSYESHLRSVRKTIDHYKNVDGKLPYVIPPGGTSPLGTTGYVNAGLELRDQIDKGLLKEPSAIYVALGTMGTAVGLLLGLRIASVKAKIIGVRVVPDVVASYDKFISLFNETNQFLHHLDPSFPLYSLSEEDFIIDNRFFGPGYGYSTEASDETLGLLSHSDNLHLDRIYTAKACTCFVNDAMKKVFDQGPLLFWNTKSSASLVTNDSFNEYTKLPAGFHHYFETNGA